MNIVENIKKLGVSFDGDLPCPSLEQRPRPLVPFVEILCIANIKFAQKRCNAPRHNLRKKQVIAVLHQTPAMYRDERFAHIVSVETRAGDTPVSEIMGQVVYGASVVESVQVVNKSHAVLDVEDYRALINAPIQYMK